MLHFAFRDEYMSEVCTQLYGNGYGYIHKIFAHGDNPSQFIVVFRLTKPLEEDKYIYVTKRFFDCLSNDSEEYEGVSLTTKDACKSYSLFYEHVDEDDE